MIFRRQRSDRTRDVLGAGESARRGRRREPDDVADVVPPDVEFGTEPAGGGTAVPPRGAAPRGPFDVADVDVEESAFRESHIDLGGIWVPASPQLELRLSVDPQGVVNAVLLQLGQSAVEIRAFAAPRSTGIWADVRREMAAEATRLGGTAAERDGRFGTEVRLVVPGQGTNGSRQTQVSRVVGVDGPRWFCRGTFLGRAVDPPAAGPIEQMFAGIVVVRGRAPMAPRELIPLHLPDTGPPVPESAPEQDAGEEPDGG